MPVTYVARPLLPLELRYLARQRNITIRELAKKPRYYLIVGALIIATISTYLASITTSGYVGLSLGIIAAFAWIAGLISLPQAAYQNYKQLKARLLVINKFLVCSEIKTIPVTAIQIGIARGYDDEGDFIVIEYKLNQLLFLWDHSGRISTRFPCLKFEIYEPDFENLCFRMINPISDKISPKAIDTKAKMEIYGRKRATRTPCNLRGLF